jgi:transposase
MTGAVTDGDGLLLFAAALDGNTADCSFNEQTISLLKTVYGPELRKHVYIADSKLLTKPNVLALMQGESCIPFISRIPANFGTKLSETMRCKAYEQNKWENLGTCCSHASTYSAVYYATTFPVTVFSFDMHVHVYKTTEKREKIEKKVKRDEEKLAADLEKLGKKEFFCKEDAVTDMTDFLRSHSNLLVEAELQAIQEVTLKNPRGRPSKNPKPPE